MFVTIDELPVGRILGEESTVTSGEDQDEQPHETDSRQSIQKRAILSREDFITMLKTYTRPPKSIASEEAATTPLYDVFANLYLPKINSRRSSMQMMQTIVDNATSNTALAKSAKTVSLWILSREHKQSRFSHTAAEMYSDALRCTRQELMQPNVDKVVLIGVGHMLSLYELFVSGVFEDSGARAHTKWVISLIESCCRDPQFPRAHPLLSSPMRLFATWEGLNVRQLPNGLPLPPLDLRVHDSGSMATLSDLCIMTANLIEASDQFCAQQSLPDVSRILDMIERLVRVESKLHVWMASYYENTAGNQLRLVATAREKRRAITPLLLSSYEFVDLESTIMHIGYWMCLLALVDAQRDIWKTYCRYLDIDSSEPFVRLEKLANEYADHIRMSIPFMGRPNCGWSGRVIAIRPLRFLLQHFRKRGEWQKLGWCVQCAIDLAV